MAWSRQGYISSLMPSGVYRVMQAKRLSPPSRRGDPRMFRQDAEADLEEGCKLGAAGLLECGPASPSASRASWAPRAGCSYTKRCFSRVAWILSELSRSVSVRAVKDRSSAASAALNGCAPLQIDSSWARTAAAQPRSHLRCLRRLSGSRCCKTPVILHALWRILLF